MWLFRGALQEEGVLSALLAAGNWVKERVVPQPKNWRVVATGLWTVEGYRTPDEAMVC